VPALCIIAAYQQASADQRRTLMELTGSDDGPTVVLPVLATDIGHVADLVAALPYDLAQARRGDLIFWKGHVAIVRDAATLVHANAHQMAVGLEPAAAAIARIRAPEGSEITSVRRLPA